MPTTGRFRLETLLKVRRLREDERKRAVAARLRAISACTLRKAELGRAMDEQTQAMRGAAERIGRP